MRKEFWSEQLNNLLTPFDKGEFAYSVKLISYFSHPPEEQI
ncbi:hypothetical protein BROSI_A0683 [Candidatus Brocadia sinica JPN1]|uniref:Uncharacterized protein n=1 Tax=Candidatus Brocadia sinica JPN1 TaxID=1197129 RepID=A0ABQ0JTV7_9BACT|nr:hypothetical protein BROSI_A0683 [Candidatus Brocadia sinica JPN1]